MQRVRKFLSESDNLKEINRQRKSCDTSGLIDATLIEEMMAQITQISIIPSFVYLRIVETHETNCNKHFDQAGLNLIQIQRSVNKV